MLSRRLTVVAFLLLDCGGVAAYDDPSAQATGGHGNTVGTGGTSKYWLDAGIGGTSTGGQVYSTYTAQGCPNVAAPTISAECDIFDASSTCPPGFGCFPTVRNSNDPCQPAQYSFVCAAAGTAGQSDFCDQTLRCAPGYICVISSIGTECQQLCDTTNSANGCLPGMRCDPVDVPGVGTCS
jgi:hypothetical protein